MQSLISRLLVNIRKLIVWVKNKLSHQQFMLFSCVAVGLSVGLATVALKIIVFRIENFVFEKWKIGNILWYQSLLPFIGIGLCILIIQNFFKKDFVRGSDKIVYAIAKKSSNLPFSQTYSHIITSGITVGFGGSLGLESPIVATGAAIGSNYGKSMLMSYKDKTLLIACGVASGTATAFSAPIAGVLFALEVLFIEVSTASFIPLLISSATGSILGKILLGDEILLNFNTIQAFEYNNTIFYIGIGLFAGLLSILHSRVFQLMDGMYSKITKVHQRWIIGSLGLSILIFFFPQLYGEGYLTIQAIAETGNIDGRSMLMRFTDNQWVILIYLIAVLLLKMVASGLTLFAGGNGGNIAPSLFIGGLLGFVLARFCQLIGFDDIPITNFIVAGMTGMLSGIFFAPLTAIFLSAEVTNGYSLLVPLMIVSAISFFVVKSFEGLSYEMKRLSKVHHIDVTDKDSYLMSRLELSLLINHDYPSFLTTSKMDEILHTIAHSDKDVYSVVDENGHYKGVIRLKNFKHVFMEEMKDSANITAKDFMQKEEPLTLKDDIDSALHKFEISENTNSVLPVTDSNGKMLGFIRKSSILDKYRKELLNSSDY